MRTRTRRSRRAPGGPWVLAKYLLLQLPGWCVAALVLTGLVRWWELRPGLAGILFAIWVAKDFVIYPFVRSAYGPGPGGPDAAVRGARALAQETLAPAGYVRLGGELWHAELRDARARVAPGAGVRVVGLRGLTLVVEPEEEATSEAARPGS